MKVGFLINDLSSGGAEQATCGITGYLANNGVDTTIITIKECVPFYDVSDEVKIVSLFEDNKTNGAGIHKVFASIKKSFLVRKKIKALNLDIVVGMSNIMSYYLVFSTIFTKTKCIGTERTDPHYGTYGIIHKILKKTTGKLSDGFIFQTKKQQDFYPIPRCGQSKIIPNAVFNKYAYFATVPKEREKTVTSLGRLVIDVKKQDDLINAFILFHKNHDDYKLQIFGEGPDKEKILSIIEKNNAKDFISIIEPRKDAILYAAKSSAYVLSSKFEGLPNALLEALYCGIPSISTDCSPAVRDLIENNENGIIVKVGDVEAISNALDRIVSDKDFCEKLSRNAIESTKKYDINNIGKEWIDYFDYLLS